MEDQKSLCPIRALRAMWIGPVIFACQRNFSSAPAKKGYLVSKQMLLHRILEAISLAYASQGADYPIGVRAHSTRGLASSWAISIKDICLAGWYPSLY